MSSSLDKDNNIAEPSTSYVSSLEEPFVEFESSELNPNPSPKFDDAYLFVVLCPPDGGPWAIFTCTLGFLALLICDGICLSLILLDGRVGMVENLPPGTRTFEHLAVIYLFRYLTEPFSCAYINLYGFRYCLLIGSILSVAWLTLLCIIENTFTHEHYVLAIIGGIGMGMIKTSFFVLLSTLFVVKRHTAHLSLHLGSFTGMLIIPSITEFKLLVTADLKSALYVNLGIMCLTLVFWLFVSTPVTLKLDIDDGESIIDTTSPPRSRAETMAWNIENFHNVYTTLTVQDTIGDRKLFTSLFLASMPIVVNAKPLKYAVRNLNYSNWIYEEYRNRRLCVRNITNMFQNRVIGSRPMYRDDVLYDGNISLLLMANIKSKNKNIEYNEYLMTMTRIYTVADVVEERSKWFSFKFPIAINRVLKCMFNMSIWFNEQFLLMVVSEALIHAACLVPFMFIKGLSGQKTSAEAVITLMAGCFGLLYGRGLGHVMHGRSPDPVPLYHVGLVLIANGLSLLLCATTTNDISNLLPYFGFFGVTFGYYKSIQNVVLYTAFPVKKFNNVCGQISLVRGVSSFAGILIAVNIMRPENDGRPATSCQGVYVYAGILMMIGSVCVTVLQQSANALNLRSPYYKVSAVRR
ncbi:uncharacterized protein LOC132924664 isoform X1 [Rhopalosiphum padi]|uniref:uncharacterized protein LOC132924664 isoform X1 n=1 Tax=Rhopalosiphum padi TaxID=40932 RepID=UPI00298D6235|nr:uncharacterized protein LOC132924664 isoform X1 [Rhopalosiphum padi]